MIKSMKTKMLVATVSVLGLGICQESGAKNLKEKLSGFFNKDQVSDFFNKVKVGVSKANKVFNTINDKSSTAANNAAFGTVLNNVKMLDEKLSSGAQIENLEELMQEYEQMEILRQKAQTIGATVQDKVNYLNAYNSFKMKVTVAIQNSGADLQQKSNEYNEAKNKYDQLNKMNSGADANYAASSQVPVSNTTVPNIQQNSNVQPSMQLQLPTDLRQQIPQIPN